MAQFVITNNGDPETDPAIDLIADGVTVTSVKAGSSFGYDTAMAAIIEIKQAVTSPDQ